MNIGIYFDALKESGGFYQYSLIILEAFKKIKTKNKIFLFSQKNFLKQEKKILKKLNNWEIIDLKTDHNKKFFLLRRTFGFFYDHFLRSFIGTFAKKNINFEKFNIDLMIYPGVISKIKLNKTIPYIICIHDLQHRMNPHFPEVSKQGELQERERLHKQYIEGAKVIIAETRAGKNYIQKFYRPGIKKIKILPYTIPPYITNKIKSTFIKKVKEKYLLERPFIFYPAQFWPHKNHKVIIKALKILKNKGLILDAVFVGTKQERLGEFGRVMKLAKKLDIYEQIKYLGFVSDKEIVALYKTALCLVMPHIGDPSNIPPLEAFFLGCPVINSKIDGVKEQIGKAGLLVNPNNERELAKAILKIYQNHKLRKKLIKLGKKRIKKWMPSDFSKKLNAIIKEIKFRQPK